MPTVDARLAALREFLKSHATGETVFIVEGGGEYHTKEDPFNYLMQHGAYTPDGTRIVLFPHSIEGIDPLSLDSDDLFKYEHALTISAPLWSDAAGVSLYLSTAPPPAKNEWETLKK